jgi:hypothetical protein
LGVLSMMLLWASGALTQAGLSVDFRYKPSQWQTAICLPDDPQKTLVDHGGRLLYGYRDDGHFDLSVGVSVPGTELVGQRLVSPRVPVVRTEWKGSGLAVVQHAFAIPGQLTPSSRSRFVRMDDGKVLRGWTRLDQSVNPLLGNAAIHETDALRYRVRVPAGAGRRIALAIAEGYFEQAGLRVQTMAVEGAASRTIDTVKDIGKNQVGVFWFDAVDEDGDGWIAIEARSPRGAILNGLWAFDSDVGQNGPALVAGMLDSNAEAVSYAADQSVPAPRCDAILVEVVNTSDRAVRVGPTLRIESFFPLQHDPANECFRTSGHECIETSMPVAATKRERRWLAASLAEFELAPGESRSFHAIRAVGCEDPPAVSLADAEAYWSHVAFPYGRIAVPDQQVQALIDSGIRNIRQAREIRDGLPSFQVGPTCYRNLWIIDAAFILEATAMLGEWEDARRGIEYVLSLQESDGRFELLERGHKENGIVLWTCVRHALLTRDKEWLRSVWPRLSRSAAYIQTLREQALENGTGLDDGLLPAGFVDGGLACRDGPEFSNTYWCLIGLKAAIEGAQWIGEDATALRAEFDALLAAFRNAARREARKDELGNRYLPILMGDTAVAPEKGQWTFLHAVHPGLLFDKDDPLVLGGMAMLQATEQEGMVVNTGWLDGGIWTYFAPFYAHAWLRQGNGRKAAECLYAMANHAAPTLVWREEQSLAGRKFQWVGDMPHNWAGAEFIRLAVHLLAFERGDELHLLEGLPYEWLQPGMVTQLDGVLTRFGPLSLSLAVDDAGETARLRVNALDDSCKAIVIHWPNGGTRRLKPNAAHDLVLPVPRVLTHNPTP